MMRLRKLATGAVLTANLVVLVATSKSADYPDTTTTWTDASTGPDTGWTDTTYTEPYTTPTSTTDTDDGTDTGVRGDPSIRTATDGPLDLLFDADMRIAMFEVQLDVGQELLDAGAVDLVIDLTGEHALPADAVLAVYDLADPADPLPALPAASTTILGIGGEVLEPVSLSLELPIGEGGITVHHLVVTLEGDGVLTGAATFTLRAETTGEMPLPPLVIEVQ